MKEYEILLSFYVRGLFIKHTYPDVNVVIQLVTVGTCMINRMYIYLFVTQRVHVPLYLYLFVHF